MLENLIAHYCTFGSGHGAKYIAFRWQGEIIGINQPDDITDDYFKIIEGILSLENIKFTEEIKQEASQWEILYNGRSGRTAAQFAKTVIAAKRK